ncbi:MAG: gamma-glutamyltransferase [candidate division Zixibacteria bacterium]|nr:gamma-glutamyltransferase [candidate division Zixibacteria bacterium]NIR62591.1 gamma-glutamyltransferase [candidate division Zixibacteria bacterium]NIS15922.1 gamma-glutamyltransferase [candidate division Zixibacteria bacterium]NIS44703.1 gamma-glutamyltransferase [candidate division Zixibacteria bacterium]NIT51914.1 gamma-glutamyltransferase [candidate division Zixibacteria bacterium]
MSLKKVLPAVLLISNFLLISCGDRQNGHYFKGAIATVHPRATEIGENILARGGNAIDCAVAVGFTLAVVYPQAGNIGGGGFAIIYIGDSSYVTTLDFREKAPIFAKQDMYLDSAGNIIENASLIGHRAVAVPGTVAGLLEMHKRYGTLPLEDLLNPAIRLADSGFAVYEILAGDLEKSRDQLAQFEATRAIFFKNGEPLSEGDRLVQTDLGETLKRIRKYGRSGFYGGRTASLLEAASLEAGGILTRTDLQEYMPVWRPPIVFDFHDLKIFSMGLPSSGGILLAEIFNMMEGFDLPSRDPYNPMFVHLFVAACKRAYADRAEHLGDIDFVDVPMQELTSEEYARRRIADFDPTRAIPSNMIDPGVFARESESTTHFSIVDQYDNAVGITYTINASFGSKVIVDSLGFFLNNEMDDFVAKPGVPNLYGLVGGEANKIEPQKRPLSSMSPTLVFKDDSLLMVTGSPGGSKIITTVAMSILRYFQFDMSLKQAINQPKFHHQHLPDILYYEIGALEKNEARKLEGMGYTLKEISAYGNLNVAARKSPDKPWEAEADRRRQGKAGTVY